MEILRPMNSRRKIDGLRAITVFPVIMFHAGLDFRGGFVGIDVFFVISGYLIITIIFTQFIAHGTPSNQKECEYSVELNMQEIKRNALSAIPLLAHLANRFEIQRSGTIDIISSVAGDRGRASNYVYVSAKAMMTTFNSWLRQRFYKSEISVVTIKSCFVDAPMTAEFKKGLLWVKPKTLTEKIVLAVDKLKDEVCVLKFWWTVMALIKAIPSKLFKRAAL